MHDKIGGHEILLQTWSFVIGLSFRYPSVHYDSSLPPPSLRAFVVIGDMCVWLVIYILLNLIFLIRNIIWGA